MIPTPFQTQVYKLCSQIPKGKVTTYQQIARALNTKAYQAIGQALRCNPYAPQVPCHRVIKSDGTIGGFMGAMDGKNIERKISLLRQEGVTIQVKTINLKRYLYIY